MILLHGKLSLLAQTASVMSSCLPLKTIPLPDKTKFPGSGNAEETEGEGLCVSHDNGAFCWDSLTSMAIKMLLWGHFFLLLCEIDSSPRGRMLGGDTQFPVFSPCSSEW